MYAQCHVSNIVVMRAPVSSSIHTMTIAICGKKGQKKCAVLPFQIKIKSEEEEIKTKQEHQSDATFEKFRGFLNTRCCDLLLNLILLQVVQSVKLQTSRIHSAVLSIGQENSMFQDRRKPEMLSILPPFLLILTQIVLGVLSKDHSSYIFRPSEGPQYVCTAQSSQVGGRPFPRRRSSFGRYTSWRLPELYAGSRGTRKLVHCSAAKVEGVSPCSQAVLERRQPSIDSVPLHTSLNTQVSTHCVRRLRLARRQPSPSLCMLLLQQALKKRPVIVYHVCWEAHSLIHTHTAATRGLAAHMLST